MKNIHTRSKSYKKQKDLIKIKSTISRKLRKHLFVFSITKQIYNVFLLGAFKLIWKTTTMLHKTKSIDIDKTIWIKPEEIKYSGLFEFNPYNFKGSVLGGDWDILTKKFEDIDIFISLDNVINRSINWRDTIFFKRLIERIKSGETPWNCSNEEDIHKRCNKIEKLFFKIKSEGYKTQGELMQEESVYDRLKLGDEIIVSIGRDGDLLFSNSAHRLAIAKLLNIKKIPVKIAVRHKEWMKFRNTLLLYCKSHQGKLSQPAMHPDLIDIPFDHNNIDRYNIIKQNISTFENGTLLDVGANLGYFCHKFEDDGFKCYAVESSKNSLFFLKKIKRASNKKFRVIEDDILEWKEVIKNNYDVVLALNIFHHFTKSKDMHDKFVYFLNNLKVKELFFEPHDHDEPYMKSSYKNFHPEEFVEFILQESMLNNYITIGETNDGKKIYKLS